LDSFNSQDCIASFERQNELKKVFVFFWDRKYTNRIYDVKIEILSQFKCFLRDGSPLHLLTASKLFGGEELSFFCSVCIRFISPTGDLQGMDIRWIFERDSILDFFRFLC